MVTVMMPDSKMVQIRAQVRIPPGVRPGQHFPVMLEGQQVMVRCPERASQGDLIQIEFQVRHLWIHDSFTVSHALW